jgi:hypothetical protein
MWYCNLDFGGGREKKEKQLVEGSSTDFLGRATC